MSLRSGLQRSRMEDLLALPEVTESRDGVRDREEDGCTRVRSVDIKAAENY